MEGRAQGYLIGNFTVTDPELMIQYSQQAGPLAESYGGEVVVAVSDLAVVEGQAQSTLIVIRFPNLDKAKAFYQDPAYAPVRELRVKATTGGFLALVPGLPIIS